MKRIFLYAYDKVNLGDDMFVRTIANRYPDTKFYLWTDRENEEIFRNVSNLKILDKNGAIPHFLGRIRGSFEARYRTWLETRCDASVYIGGSIFMEYPNWKNFVDWWDYKAGLHPFFVLGANFGPYHTPEYPERLSEVLPKLTDLCFRDHYSANIFKKCANVRCEPDILFSYPMPKAKVKNRQVFVSLIHCAARDQSHGLSAFQDHYLQNVTMLLKQYLADGYTVVLSSFCKEEGDEVAVQTVMERLGEKEKVRCLNYRGTNMEEVLQAISESEYVIASRFHAAILAMAAGRPVLPIIYSDKTTHVLEDLNFSGRIYDLRDESDWDYQDSRENLDRNLAGIPQNIKVEAEKHFKKLDEFLSRL